MFGMSHKTVYVLDHSSRMAVSSKQSLDLDVFTKGRVPGIIPLAPIAKSLWTCVVESAMEYCRILYDIFPTKKLVRFLVSDSRARHLNRWNEDDQSLQHLAAALATVGPPDAVGDGNEYVGVAHGLLAAVEVLCQCSEMQHSARTRLLEHADRVGNRGRIVCLMSARSDNSIRMLEETVMGALQDNNKLAAGSDSLMQIQSCELVFINVFPVSDDSMIVERARREISPVLSSEVHSVRAGRYLSAKLTTLVQQHFDLAFTTITNIPMKEEQHANTSANYDVELLHHREAHAELFKIGDASLMSSNSKDGMTKDTVTLKWCTPRTNNVELHYCTGVYRISPVDVNSRPSSCLTNFLLNGRSVMLEQPRKSGTKVVGHMLCSHGGEIFLHVLSSSRSTLEDPPSISEGCGGRVTDYRITDFGEFMKENRLAPAPVGEEGFSCRGDAELPLERAKAQLERHTRYWPMIISQTTIFNMQAVVPLANLVVKEALADDEVLECQKAIYHIVDMERKSDPLPISTAGSRGKGPKRDEQYRLMWNELEALVRAHASNSSGHTRVLDCLLACRSSRLPEDDERRKGKRRKEEREERANREVEAEAERFRSGNERDKEPESEIIKDSPDSPEPVPAVKRPRLVPEESKILDKRKGPMSLLELWTSQINVANSRKHQEFIGRLNSTGNRAELYQHLMDDMSEAVDSKVPKQERV